MCFCLAQPVMLASLCSGEGCRGSAGIAGQGAGMARWVGSARSGGSLCRPAAVLPTGLKLLNWRALWTWTSCLLGKRQRTQTFFVRDLSLPLLPLHMQSPRRFRLARRRKIKGCVGNFHVSRCAPALCWPCGDSSSEPQSSKAVLAMPKTITAGSQHRYGLAPTQQYRVQDAGKHRDMCLCLSVAVGAGQGL